MQPWMALVALLKFCAQFLFIPFLQKAINLCTRRRIETLRALGADIVNEETDAARERMKKTFRRRIRDVYRLNMQTFLASSDRIF
mgnify:CR=1 FL=1